MHRVYGWTVLIALMLLAAVGAAHGSDADDARVDLVITTHNPPCTAIFMDGRSGVILQTKPRPLPLEGGYTLNEIENGINVTYSMPASRANALMPVLVERPEVFGVASYSTSEPPTLLANATNTDPPASLKDRIRSCGFVQENLYRAVYDAVLRNAESQAVQGQAASERIIWLSISTSDSNAELLKFLKEHGITPNYISESTPTRVGGMDAFVPVSLLPKIMEVEHVVGVREVPRAILVHGYGATESEGVDFHSQTESWHNSTYDGAGVDIAVIDAGFEGFMTAELPPVSTSLATSSSLLQSTQFRCYHGLIPSSTNATLCRGYIDENGTLTPEPHGTQVAEIVMDMAPGANLYLVRAGAIQQIYHALPWLVANGVDVVVMSAVYPFEGTGDCTSQRMAAESLLAVIDDATDNGIVWVNAAGNYTDG